MSVQDVVFSFVLITMLAFSAVVGFHVYGLVNQEFINTGEFTGASGVALNETQTNLENGLFDNVFFIAFIVGAVLSLIVLAFGLGASPVYSIAYIIALISEVMVSIPLSNAYYAFSQNSLISGSASQFTLTNYIMYNLPIFMFVVGIIIAIVIYGARRQMGAIDNSTGL